MELLRQIIENSKLSAEKIKTNLLHPVLNTTDYEPREILSELTDIADNHFHKKSVIRMVGLAGLRGTGKTTLLWQTADYIYKNYTQNIYFFHLGDLKKFDIGVREIHKGFEKYFANGKLWTYKEPIVFLFDEVHEDSNWAGDLKVLYDLFHSVFVVATGSSALLLQSTADLVTRMLIQRIYPLSFNEYITIKKEKYQNIKKLQKDIKNILFYSDSADELFNSIKKIEPEINNYFSENEITTDDISNYIKYHNITRVSLETNKERIDALISDLVRRVVYEDIHKLSNKNRDLLNSEKILQRIAASDELNIQTLSQTMGISQSEINENIEILSKAELLNILYPFGGIDTKINKTQKYFFMSPSIRRVLLKPLTGDKDEKSLWSKMLEDTVVLYLKRIFNDNNIISFTSYRKGKNPDLIIETLPKPIIMEIGINKKTTKQITQSKIKYKYGIIINSKTNKIEQQDDVIIMPLKYFLLL